MKRAPCWLLMIAMNLTGQIVREDPAVSKLTSTLVALASLPKVPDGHDFFGNSLRKDEKCFRCVAVPEFQQFMKNSQQLADDLMSLTDRYYRPTTTTVSGFADALTSVLAGRDLPPDLLSEVTISIVETLNIAVNYVEKNGFKGKTFQERKANFEDRFSRSVVRARKALIALNVGAPYADMVAERLALMAKSVWALRFRPID